eukprot:jgi/Mesvir1/25575/Mv01806-RA.4
MEAASNGTPFEEVRNLDRTLASLPAEWPHAGDLMRSMRRKLRLPAVPAEEGRSRLDGASGARAGAGDAGSILSGKRKLDHEDGRDDQAPLRPLPADSAEGQQGVPKLVVLDDDPTGTQTVNGVHVLTTWSVDVLETELRCDSPGFFVLTNSRALPANEASSLMEEICGNLREAAGRAGCQFTVVLRGDSTLRGHFPQEPEAVQRVLGPRHLWVICPFFLEGGRYTVGDVHYVADGQRLVPAGQTEFAKDHAFGYTSSNLKQWVDEKSQGAYPAAQVRSVSLDDIRQGGPPRVYDALMACPHGSIVVVNAAASSDVLVVATAVLQVEQQGVTVLVRSAAAFVSARLGVVPKSPIRPASLRLRNAGGLIVVGSYVPKTSKQVEALIASCSDSLLCLPVSVADLTKADADAVASCVEAVARAATAGIRHGVDVLVYTSRELVKGKDATESLSIGQRVSDGLVRIVRAIAARPRYILAKGGVTSSDVATKALGIKRALVIGQAAPGIPLWQPVDDASSRYPGMPYIVFPGNVGGITSLADLVHAWSLRPNSVQLPAMLGAATRGGYAVGAFNVYNIEGVLAVTRAAERLQSPAILQIHPSSLQFGGAALVACCAEAARSACVPIGVHLDHGSDERQIVEALDTGLFTSIMVDGSALPFHANVAFTKRVAELAHTRGVAVEAELGRLSGTEDGLTVEEYLARLTDAEEAKLFVQQTGVDALAVCIGNVHGNYPKSGPKLDFARLKAIAGAVAPVPLVLHGASGLPEDMVKVRLSTALPWMICSSREFDNNNLTSLHYGMPPGLPVSLHLLWRACG